MEQDDFWALIQTLRSRPRDEDFARLTDALATRGADDIIGFEDILTELLHALDTPAHAAAVRAGNDWFLYVRCAVVAAGRRAYEEVVAEPARLKRFARREAELLLTVAPQAYERSTGLLWEHETRLSYESGSNAAAWGDTEPTPEPPAAQEPTPWPQLRATAMVGVFAVAALVGAAAAGLGASGVEHGATAAAMLALGVGTAVAGRAAPPPRRRALVAFCLLLAASAVVHVVAHRIPVPALGPKGLNGCFGETEATTEYWRGQLRYGHIAEILRYLALACALRTVRMMPEVSRPRPWRRPVVTALLLAPLVVIGLVPIVSASDVPAVFAATAPGALTLVTAAILVGLTTTRAGGRRAGDGLLVVGVLLMMISSATAVETLAGLHSHLPEPVSSFTLGGCFYGIATTSVSISAIATAAIYVAGPALFVRSALLSSATAEL